jgi:hypothetical protein
LLKSGVITSKASLCVGECGAVETSVHFFEISVHLFFIVLHFPK